MVESEFVGLALEILMYSSFHTTTRAELVVTSVPHIEALSSMYGVHLDSDRK